MIWKQSTSEASLPGRCWILLSCFDESRIFRIDH
jgi:hypothetical protein